MLNLNLAFMTNNNMERRSQINLLLSLFLFFQWSFTCLNSNIEGLEQGVKCVQS